MKANNYLLYITFKKVNVNINNIDKYHISMIIVNTIYI